MERNTDSAHQNVNTENQFTRKINEEDEAHMYHFECAYANRETCEVKRKQRIPKRKEERILFARFPKSSLAVIQCLKNFHNKSGWTAISLTIISIM